MERITQLQQGAFGFLNEFHTNRTETILKGLYEHYGESLIDVAEKQPIDLYGLYQWHTERYVGFLEHLRSHYGDEVLKKIVDQQMQQEEANGRIFSEAHENAFQKLVDHFTGGVEESVVENTDQYVIIKTGNCFAGKIAHNLGKSELLYDHHCGLDHAFVKGFNPKLRLEIQKTILQGETYCLHKIWK